MKTIQTDLKNTKKTEEVSAYMSKLRHPLKAEMEAVRTIIKGVNKNIAERIKWNAPSCYYKSEKPDETNRNGEMDFVTFNPGNTKKVHPVFHHEAIVKIKSPLLEGNYKDRRMLYLNTMADVKANKKALENIINELLKLIDK